MKVHLRIGKKVQLENGRKMHLRTGKKIKLQKSNYKMEIIPNVKSKIKIKVQFQME